MGGNTSGTMEGNDPLNETSSEEEISSEMGNVKESASGRDGVRICYIDDVCGEIKEEVIKMDQFMFNNREKKGDKILKEGHLVPIHIKNRNENYNYMGVSWLAMVMRILA